MRAGRGEGASREYVSGRVLEPLELGAVLPGTHLLSPGILKIQPPDHITFPLASTALLSGCFHR